MTIQDLGFKGELPEINKGSVGRVIVEHKHMYRISDGNTEYLGELTGKFRFEATSRNDYPAVGDFVLFSKLDNGKALIHEVLPRSSSFARQAAGLKTEEQIIATNIDYVFIVNALNDDFNIRRLERYLTLAYESGASPIFIFTKKDLCENIEIKLHEAEKIAFGVPMFAISSIEREGIEELQPYLKKGDTITLVGSSGVGKSTLLNTLMGVEIQKTQEIRNNDDKGKHTTTHRELFSLPNGALIIDTPGMRELQLWSSGESISTVFQDIDELVSQCKFTDCSHNNEPGCAIKKALENGSLENERYESYKKLQKEIAYHLRKQDVHLMRAEKEKWKKIKKSLKTNKI